MHLISNLLHLQSDLGKTLTNRTKKFVDLVAQLVEHLPFKERVLGSNPSQITFKKPHSVRLFLLAPIQRKSYALP